MLRLFVRTMVKGSAGSRSFSQKTKTIGEAAEELKQKLRSCTDVTQPRMEAEIILGHVLKASREELLRSTSKPLHTDQWRDIERLATRRVRGEPLSYITHHKPFWRHVFVCTDTTALVEGDTMRDTALIEEDGSQVTPVKGTLIPRPCTEVLVETALSLIAQHGPARGTLLDLGTGSGCIAVSLLSELVAWRAVAVDLDDTALKVARVNASRVLGDLTRIEFVKSDWTKQLPSREFDLIVANPPYIATAACETLTNTVKHYEPELALFGGVTGLEALEAISSQISQFMKANSYLLLEIGYDQHKQVIELFAQRARLTHVRTVKDYEGFDRCVVFQK